MFWSSAVLDLKCFTNYNPLISAPGQDKLIRTVCILGKFGLGNNKGCVNTRVGDKLFWNCFLFRLR